MSKNRKQVESSEPPEDLIEGESRVTPAQDLARLMADHDLEGNYYIARAVEHLLAYGSDRSTTHLSDAAHLIAVELVRTGSD